MSNGLKLGSILGVAFVLACIFQIDWSGMSFSWEDILGPEDAVVSNPDFKTDITAEQREQFAEGHERGMYYDGSKMISMTKLNEEGMKIQEEQGCNASVCHKK